MKSRKQHHFLYMIKRLVPVCFQADRFDFILFQFLSVLTGIMNGAEVFVTQIFIDSVYNAAREMRITVSVVTALTAFIALRLFLNIVEGIKQVSADVNLFAATENMNAEIQMKAARIEPVEFEIPQHLDRIEKASEGIDSAHYLVTSSMSLLTYHLPYIVFLIIYLHSLKPIMILCLILIFAPIVLSHLLRSSKFTDLEDISAPLRREYEAYFNATCGKEYYKETRSLGLFSYMKGMMIRTIKSMNEAALNTRKKAAKIDFMMNTLSLLGYGGVLLLCVKYLLTGDITIGAFAAVYASIDTLYSEIEFLVDEKIGSMIDELGLVRNFIDFIDMPEKAGHDTECNKEQDIVLSHVSFCYPNSSETSIKDVNLTVKQGETIALVGENGAGKTTLVRLMIGLYKPTEGTVKIGGTDISEISFRSLFKGISGVFQRYQRYAFSLEDNIRIADYSNAKDEASIIDLLTMNGIQANDLESYPDGLDTILSREYDGIELSGGQWQRLAIARGLYRDSSIIVLDEPTASIDPIEESYVYQRFSEYAKNKTAVVVTHRLGSARIADRIVVMKDGFIVEIGTHEELMALGGEYAKMYAMQAKWYY